MEKDIVKFGFSTIIVLLALITIDLTVGIMGEKVIGILPDYGGAINKANYALNRITNTDVIIIGSSRASHHYNTCILKDSIASNYPKYNSFYNAGLDGHFSNCSFSIFESIVQRYKPKLVILDINISDFCTDRYSNIEDFAMYYKSNDVVKKYIDKISLKERILMCSSLYRYNCKPFRIAKSLLSANAIDDGYQPLYNKMTIEPHIKAEESQNLKINKYTLENFERILQLSKQQGVPLIIALSPRYKGKDIGVEIVLKKCKEHGIPFIDMFNTNYFNMHKELFQDASHLNDDGARIYTSLFFQKIKTYL